LNAVGIFLRTAGTITITITITIAITLTLILTLRFELYLKTLKVWVGPFSRRDVMIIIAALYVFTGQLAFFLYFLFQLPQQSCF